MTKIKLYKKRKNVSHFKLFLINGLCKDFTSTYSNFLFPLDLYNEFDHDPFKLKYSKK